MSGWGRYPDYPDESGEPLLGPPPTPEQVARWQAFAERQAALSRRMMALPMRPNPWPVCPSEALVAELEREAGR